MAPLLLSQIFYASQNVLLQEPLRIGRLAFNSFSTLPDCLFASIYYYFLVLLPHDMVKGPDWWISC